MSDLDRIMPLPVPYVAKSLFVMPRIRRSEWEFIMEANAVELASNIRVKEQFWGVAGLLDADIALYGEPA